MPGVRVRENEHFDAALRRFKRACEKAGVLTELRRREFYEKPTQERKAQEGGSRQASTEEERPRNKSASPPLLSSATPRRFARGRDQLAAERKPTRIRAASG